MSALIGDRLPPGFLATFDGSSLATKVGLGYLLLTADADGSPRPCMLSPGEILATDERHVRLALWAGSHTSANLAREASNLLCYVAKGSVLYVRGRPRALGRIEHLGVDCFEVEVSSVESDDHPGMPVVDTIRFELTGPTLADVAAEWQERIAALRAL